MDLVYHLTIPADTAEASPAEETLPSIEGIIHLVEIEQASGCKGMVYDAIRQGAHQVWPSNPDGGYRSNRRVYSTREHYEVRRGDPAFVLQGWSPGTTYQHVVEFRLSVLPVEILEPWRQQESLLTKLLKLFGGK